MRAVLKFTFLFCRATRGVGRMSAFKSKWQTSEKRAGCQHRRGAGRSPPQSPAPEFGEKYCSLSGLPSHSLESAGGAFLAVIFGQIFAYFALSINYSSSHGLVSGFLAFIGP